MSVTKLQDAWEGCSNWWAMVEPHKWLDFLPAAVLARLALSIAASSHQRAVEHAEGAFASLKNGDDGLAPAPLVKLSVLRSEPAFWVSVALCVVAEAAIMYSIVLGGAVSLPLLAAGGALLDALGRWLFLAESPPKQRMLAGGALAAVAAAAAAHFAPLPLALSGDVLWVALQEPPALLVLALLLGGAALLEMVGAGRLQRSDRERATLLSVQAGLLGALSALGSAALGSCLRHELLQSARSHFDTPCAVALASIAALAHLAQGRRLASAYRLSGHGARMETTRVHVATLVLCAPIAIAAVRDVCV